jgi:hypothetical protein
MLKLMRRICRGRPVLPPRSAFTGFRFPREVIMLAVRWYLRYGLSCRDVEELMAERGVLVDHVTIHRWVQRFIPILAQTARCTRHGIGSRWQIDETYVKIAGCWRYAHRAVDEYGQVIDVYISPRRDSAAARRFFHRALATAVVAPVEEGYRPGRVLPAGARRGASPGVASHRALRQQQDRSRPRPVETTATTDAQPEEPMPAPGLSSPGTPSSRTSAAATTNLPPMLHRSYVSQRPSTSSLKQFDPRPAKRLHYDCDQQRNKT